MPITVIGTTNIEKSETNNAVSPSSERSFDMMKEADIAAIEKEANYYAVAKEYPEQIKRLENFVRALNRHNILIKKTFSGYEIAADSVPNTVLPPALLPRLQNSLNKLYTNSYVISKELQGIKPEDRRDISQETNLKKEHVSTQLETAILNNLLYSDASHSSTVFSTVPSLKFEGIESGKDIKQSDVINAIKKKAYPTAYEKQVLVALENASAFDAESKKDTKFSQAQKGLSEEKQAQITKILAEYGKAFDSKNVSLGTRKEIHGFTKDMGAAFSIEPEKLAGKSTPRQILESVGTLGYRAVHTARYNFSTLTSHPVEVASYILSIVSLLFPKLREWTVFKAINIFSAGTLASRLATRGDKSMVDIIAGTTDAFLNQGEKFAKDAKLTDYNSVEDLSKFEPLRDFEKVLTLSPEENKLTNIVYGNITVGNLLANTALDESNHDITINTNALFTPEEKKILAKWPNFKVDAVYKKMLNTIYDTNAEKIRKMFPDKHVGRMPFGYSKEYLATQYLKHEYKYTLTGTEYEGNNHCVTTSFARVFEYELLRPSQNVDKKIMEQKYTEYLATKAPAASQT